MLSLLVIHGLHETMFMTVSHSVVKEAQGMTHPHLHGIRDSGREGGREGGKERDT